MRFIPTPLKHRPRLWDSLIAILGLAAVLLAMGTAFPWNVAAGAALLLLLYCSLVEPRIILTKRIDVPLRTARALRIAFISDFHVGPYKGRGFMRRVVEKTNALRPDLILLGGDFLFDFKSDPSLLDPLGKLRATLGIFAVMGNHDSGRDCLHGKIKLTQDRTQDVEKVLAGCGIVTLHNEWRDLGDVVVAGTDDIWMESYDLGKTLAGIPEGKPVILLTHNPDAVLDERVHRADLVLAGHTHGGQVRLPLLGSVSPIPNELGRKYDRGTFALEKETTLVVSHGVGESMARPRLMTVPEILLLETGL